MQTRRPVKFPAARSEESLGFMFWQTSNLWQRRLSSALKPLDLTPAQFALLAGIARLEIARDSITQIRLARKVRLDAMMTSQVLRKLEIRGLIQRRLSELDSRANIVELTEKGRDLTVRGLDVAQRVDTEFFAPLRRKQRDFLEALGSLVGGNETEEVS